MVIVGSRGLTKIKNMLLGSVSYYLVQKSSVPVMVARRRLRQHARPRKHMSQLDRHARVPLSHAETEMESHAAEVHSSSSSSDDSGGHSGSEDGTELGDVSDNKSEKSHNKARGTTDESGPGSGSGSDSDERSEDEDEKEQNQSTLTSQADASNSSSAAEGLQS